MSVELLGEGLLLIIELDAVWEGRIDSCFKDFFDAFDDVLAVFSCVNNPTDILFEGFKVAFGLIEAAFTIYHEDLFNNSQDVEQQSAFRVIAGSTNAVLDTMEQY